LLTAKYYYTRWEEAIATKNSIATVVRDFLETHIITHFGTLVSLVCDNGMTFQAIEFTEWAYDNHITLRFSSNYYQQGNGLAESTNKNIINVIKKAAFDHPRQWYTLLKYVL